MGDNLAALTTIFTEFYYWVTVVLMFLIHVGFCMYEVGVSRRRNHLHTLLKNTMAIPLVAWQASDNLRSIGTEGTPKGFCALRSSTSSSTRFGSRSIDQLPSASAAPSRAFAAAERRCSSANGSPATATRSASLISPTSLATPYTSPDAAASRTRVSAD